MPKFLLLVSPERPAAEALSPAELGRRTQDFMDWVDELRREDALDSGGLLGPDSVRLSLGLHGPCPSSDFPCAPGAPIRLYFIIEAAGFDTVVEMASRCPSALPGTVDVFELEAALALSAVGGIGVPVA